MTVATTVNKIIAQGNGVTTAFTYNFKMASASYARVILTYVDGTQAELTSSQYTISGVDSATGGTVTYPLTGSPISSGTSITIMRELPLRQSITIENQGNFYPAAVDNANDQSRYIDQQLQEQINRSLIVAPGDPDIDPLPAAAARASRYLYFDSDGQPTAAAAISGSVNVSAQMVAVVEASSRSTAFALLKPALAEYIYAMDYGVVADGTTNDTAAWNTIIALINATNGLTVIAPAGTSVNTQWNVITGTNWCIQGWGGQNNSILSFSSDEAIRISSGSAYGMIRNVGLNNTGTSTNTTIRLGGCIFQQFIDINMGTGIGQLMQAGITGAAPDHLTTAAVEIRMEGLTGIAANVAIPLIDLLNGTNFHLSNSQFYNNANPGAVSSGRILVQAAIVGPALWDTIVIENVDTFCWDYAFSGTESGVTAVGPVQLQNNIFDSCQTACFNLNAAAGGYIKEVTIQNNYMSCTNGLVLGLAGAGNCNSLIFQGNRIRIAGTSGINVTMTGSVGNLDISNNVMYDLNALAASSGTRGIQIVCTTPTSTTSSSYNSVNIIGNLVGTGITPGYANWVGGISTTSVPEYGILVSGAPYYLNVQGNAARGSVASYSITSSSTHSTTPFGQFVNNIGQTVLPVAVTVGASPFVFTTINRTATIFISGGTVSSVTVGGVVAAIQQTNESWVAPPNTIHTMMYTGSPTLAILYW